MPGVQLDVPRVLLYILRRDIRLSDNPIFYNASLLCSKISAGARSRSQSSPPAPLGRRDSPIDPHEPNLPAATHLIPIYVFPANQIEVSGFLRTPDDRSPYREAKSQVAGIWRTGPHRVKFLAESIWDLKRQLEGLECGSGLVIRVGMIEEIVEHMLASFAGDHTEKNGDSGGNGKVKADVVGIWMAEEEGSEEKHDEEAVRSIAKAHGVEFRLWGNEKYFVDE